MQTLGILIEPEAYSEYRQSLEYSLHRTFCYCAIYKREAFIRTLSNIYNGAFCSEPSVTLAYFEPWDVQNLKNIWNPVNHL